jgi:hypothetical protein
MADYEARVEIIGDLAAAFPSVEVMDQTIKTYVWGLMDLPVTALWAAIERTKNTHKFSTLPTIAEIRENAEAVAVSGGAEKHPDNCECFGTGMIQTPKDATGYSPGARRCEGAAAQATDSDDADIARW